MTTDKIVLIGAGIGALAAAAELSAQGFAVTVVEKGSRSGGKMREVECTGRMIDSGPTVFTMRWVFDALFAAAGGDFASAVTLDALPVLARHAWSETERFDLFADAARATDAVAEFSGLAEAQRYRAFCAEARAIYTTLKDTFLTAGRPNPVELAQRIGFYRPSALFALRPFETMWSALARHFEDPRLRQLFGRYATYNGSSPFLAPATLMLIAHVEQEGVWTVRGGMQRLADAVEALARKNGTTFRFGESAARISLQSGAVDGVILASGERLPADAVIVNADISALPAGLFGEELARAADPVTPGERSLSAMTWSFTAQTQGFPLSRHNVFFSGDYPAEFDDVFQRRRVPFSPTVYVCAQDRGEPLDAPQGERLFALINAPANGDAHLYDQEEIASCEKRMFDQLRRCGLTLTGAPQAMAVTTPTDFNRMFPATGGALYGRASHGWTASFRRPGARTKIPGLYLAGGSAHPGAGVPMAALSGRLAAQRLVSDRASMRRYRRAVISGGISTG